MFWKIVFLIAYFLLVFIGARIFELYATSVASLECLNNLFPDIFATKKTSQQRTQNTQEFKDRGRSSFSGESLSDIDIDSQTITGIADDIADDPNNFRATAFKSFADFEEKVTKVDDIWVIQVNIYSSNRGNLFTKNQWNTMTMKLKKFGFKTGIFSCTLKKRFCARHKIHLPSVILTTPQRQTLKGSVDFHVYQNVQEPNDDHTRESKIYKWIQKMLNPKVKTVHSLSELMERPISRLKNRLPKPSISFVYKSNRRVAPLLFSALSFRFKGRIKFYVYKTTDGHKTGNVFAMSPNTLYTYGEKRGEYFNYSCVEFFLRTLHPEVNDIFVISVILLNMACWLELFLQKGGPIKRLFYYFWGFVIGNLLLVSIWLFLIQFLYMPQIQPIIELCLKNFQYVMFSNIAAIIRQDIIQLSKHIHIVVFGFIGYGVLLGYLHYKMRNDRDRICFTSIMDIIHYDIEELKDLFYSFIGFVTPSLRIYRFEEGIERILLRLAAPDLWLHSKHPLDYLHILPTWTFFCSDIKCVEKDHIDFLNDESEQIDEKLGINAGGSKGYTKINHEDCVICLDLYKCGDIMRNLPCGHYFHKSCIDGWLFPDNEIKHHRCPVCRWPTDIKKGTVEVIDLS